MKFFSISTLLLTILIPSSSAIPQSQKKKLEAVTPPQVIRTISRHEVRRLGYGSTFTLVGAPSGSITIEGWARAEVDVSAEIELRAGSEADLELLSHVNNFVIDDDANHLQVLTTGTHDKAFMRSAKKFPKALLGLPWKIDYKIRVPISTDVEINAGRGPVTLSDVEGNIRLSATEGIANFKLTGGTLSATIASGEVDLEIPAISWRGVGAELRVAAGKITVVAPAAFSGEFDAEVLRTGQIDTHHEGLTQTNSRELNPRKWVGRAHYGGPAFKLIVGDGLITIKTPPK
jgi:hypothetical protein